MGGGRIIPFSFFIAHYLKTQAVTELNVGFFTLFNFFFPWGRELDVMKAKNRLQVFSHRLSSVLLRSPWICPFIRCANFLLWRTFKSYVRVHISHFENCSIKYGKSYVPRDEWPEKRGPRAYVCSIRFISKAFYYVTSCLFFLQNLGNIKKKWKTYSRRSTFYVWVTTMNYQKRPFQFFDGVRERWFLGIYSILILLYFNFNFFLLLWL